MFWDSSSNEYRFSLALVTGSTSGIGREICYLLAKKGINLIIHGRKMDKLKELAQELSDKVNVQMVTADLEDLQGQLKLCHFIREQKPDLLINNAGFGIYGEALDYSTDQQLEILDVNGQAVIRLTLEAARVLIADGQKGMIMNISSASAFLIFPNFSVYSATKAMINRFSESFDEETKLHGVRVLAACPGVVATNFRARAGGKEDYNQNSIKPMTAEFAANEIWKQITKGKKLHLFNWKYRAAIFFAKFIPKVILAKLMKKNVEKITV